MIWMICVSVVVVIAASTSLAASYDSRRDIATGKPEFTSIADRTGIWYREELDRLLGPRDENDRYTATTEQVDRIPRTWLKFLLDNDWCDGMSIAAALTAPALFCFYPALSVIVLTVAVLYILLGYIVSIVVVLKTGFWKEFE